MKIVYSDEKQICEYADITGFCIIKLEDGDNKENVIAKMLERKNSLETNYYNPQELTRFAYFQLPSKYVNGGTQVITGNLIRFDTRRDFAD